MSKKYFGLPIKVPRFEEAAGFYTSVGRSKLMSRIKGRDTKPELLFRRALSKSEVRYRINYKGLPGNPDISNKAKRFVVFIDGEFWHGYNWEEKKKKIKANKKFWIPKIERNMQRDKENDYKLLQMGFVVFRFWDRQVLNNLDSCVRQVVEYARASQDKS